MFKNIREKIFGGAEVAVAIKDAPKPQQQAEKKTPTTKKPVVNSKVIGKDMRETFQKSLKLTQREDIQASIAVAQLELEQLSEANKHIIDKASTLTDLGLTSTPTVKKQLKKVQQLESEHNAKAEKLKYKLEKLKELDKLIAEYALKYASFKFISSDTMFTIMQKYDLYMGEAVLYQREIPEHAINNISKFSKEIKESQEEIGMQVERHTDRYTSRGEGRINFDNVCVTSKDNLIKGGTSPNGITRYTRKSTYPGSSFYTRTYYTILESKLKLVAPLSHFADLSAETIRVGDSELPLLTVLDRKIVFNTRKIAKAIKKHNEVLDPIALLEVTGGYIVIDAWDDEAQIPEIQNPLNN